MMNPPPYVITARYLYNGDLQKAVVSLPYVPNPGHILILHGWKYRVLEVTCDVNRRGEISLDLEDIGMVR